MNDFSEPVEIEAVSLEEAIAAACARTGLTSSELAIDMTDPGSSANSSIGFRPVKVRVRRRAPQSAPDGAGRTPARAPRYDGPRHDGPRYDRDRGDRGGRGMSH